MPTAVLEFHKNSNTINRGRRHLSTGERTKLNAKSNPLIMQGLKMRGNLPPFPTHLLGLVRKNWGKFTKYQEQKINNATYPFAFTDYFLLLKLHTISTSETKNTSVGLCHPGFPWFSFLAVSLYFTLVRTCIYQVFHLLRKETLSVSVPEVISLVTVISNLMNEEDRCY